MSAPSRFSLFVLGLALSGCGDPFTAFPDLPTAGAAGASEPETEGPAASGGGGLQTGSAGTLSTTAGGGGNHGGTTGSGGSLPITSGGGTGGSVAGVAGTSIVEPALLMDLIDDVEGDFPHLPLRAGRNGAWFAVHDDSGGSATPARALSLLPERGTSRLAAGISGGGFTDWGSQLGVALKSPVTGYDASAYCGVHFVIKGSGAGWALLISDRLSSPSGGVCQYASDPSESCYHHLGKALTVGADWQDIDLRFDELAPLGEDVAPRALDKSGLFDIMFNFQSPNGESFELMVDDLSFLMSCE